MAAYVLAGAGMGFGYPRTGVAMLAASTDSDRGFNSSALSIADSLGGALSLSLSGIVFGVATRAGADPFVSVFAFAAAIAVLGGSSRRRGLRLLVSTGAAGSARPTGHVGGDDGGAPDHNGHEYGGSGSRRSPPTPRI